MMSLQETIDFIIIKCGDRSMKYIVTLIKIVLCNLII